MTQEPVESWEEEYDREFGSLVLGILSGAQTSPVFVNNELEVPRLKNFIRRLLASQKQKIREEESDQMAKAIIMSKQGWIEEGKQKQIEEVCEMLEGMKGGWRAPVENATIDDILTKLKEKYG